MDTLGHYLGPAPRGHEIGVSKRPIKAFIAIVQNYEVEVEAENWSQAYDIAERMSPEELRAKGKMTEERVIDMGKF
jgi:hypothetical protein